MDNITGVLLGEFDKLNDGHKYALAKANELCDYIIIALLESKSIDNIDPYDDRIEALEEYTETLDFSSKIEYHKFIDLKDFIENAHKTLDFNIVIFPTKDNGTCLQNHAQLVKDNFINEGRTPPHEVFIETQMDPEYPEQKYSSTKKRKRLVKGMS